MRRFTSSIARTGSRLEQSLGHRPVAIRQRAFDQRLLGQQRLELAPEGDAFEQRAALVDAWQAVAERRVHVEVRVAERRREQLAASVQRLVRGRLQAGRHFDNAAVQHRHAHVGAAIGQVGVGDQQVQHRGSP